MAGPREIFSSRRLVPVRGGLGLCQAHAVLLEPPAAPNQQQSKAFSRSTSLPPILTGTRRYTLQQPSSDARLNTALRALLLNWQCRQMTRLQPTTHILSPNKSLEVAAQHQDLQRRL